MFETEQSEMKFKAPHSPNHTASHKKLELQREGIDRLASTSVFRSRRCAQRVCKTMSMGQVEEGKAYTAQPPAADEVGDKEPIRSPSPLAISYSDTHLGFVW